MTVSFSSPSTRLDMSLVEPQMIQIELIGPPRILLRPEQAATLHRWLGRMLHGPMPKKRKPQKRKLRRKK